MVKETEYPEKTTDLSQVTDKLISNTLRLSGGLELTTLVHADSLIGTDCTGSCKSNHHTITTTTIHEEFVIISNLFVTIINSMS